MRKTISALLILVLLTIVVSAQNETIVEDSEEDLYEEEFEEIAEEGIYDDIGEVEIMGDAGLTPDSALYFLETLFENIFVGDNPETALEYKEEKILEAKAMIEMGDDEAAKKALERVKKYNEILQKEVTPEIEKRVRESSKATKELLESFELEGDEWEEVNDIIEEGLKEEDRIALSAKVAKKIKQLCESLAELDPLEYAKVCKTDDDSPKWKKDLDRELTEEQQKEAKEFFKIMSECFQNPSGCRCDDISVKPFAEQCNIIAPLAAKCEEGDEQACEEMENVEDPIDLLPDYLQEVMEEVEDEYGESKHDLHIPKECVEEGALSREACMKVMFKIHAPPECLEALESGKIDPKNENEARKACEEIMFDLEAPEECKEAGLKDHRECERHMFKLDAPQECIDAGLTGSGRNDWRKCEIIRFKLDAPQECLDAGITGEGRDDWKKCEVIKFKSDSPQECLDAGLDGSGRDDWRKCDAIRFRLDAPQECLDAGITGEERDDWRKCEAIKFKSEAHPACLAAGLDGTGRDDWRKCQKIQFKEEAPQECLDAGLDGSGRRDWDECNKIRKETEDHGVRREDCVEGQLHICEDDYCKCIDKEDYDEEQKFKDCGAVDCQRGWHCEWGRCVVDEDYDECDRCDEICGHDQWECNNGKCGCYTYSECKDGCSDECPGADRTDCIDDRCICYYEDHDDDSDSDSGSDGGSDGGSDDGSDSTTDGGSDEGSDDGTTDGDEGSDDSSTDRDDSSSDDTTDSGSDDSNTDDSSSDSGSDDSNSDSGGDSDSGSSDSGGDSGSSDSGGDSSDSSDSSE